MRDKAADPDEASVDAPPGRGVREGLARAPYAIREEAQATTLW